VSDTQKFELVEKLQTIATYKMKVESGYLYLVYSEGKPNIVTFVPDKN